MNLVAYLRVSTAKQAADGVSVDVQREKIEAYARALGHSVVSVYRDEGLSGGLAASERPGLRGALWDVEHRGNDHGLVVSSLSRLSRTVRDVLDLVDRSRDRGWHLVSLSESLDTSTATGRMVVGVLAVLAQFERELTAERTAEAISKLRGDGRAFTSQAPYGYDFVDGRSVPNVEEQWVAAYVAERTRQGWMPGVIAERLNEAGKFTRKGGKWNGDAVRRVIRSIERCSSA